MNEKRKYDREEMRDKLRNMFMNMGIDVPEDLEPRRVVVHGEHGEIIEDRVLGERPKEKGND